MSKIKTFFWIIITYCFLQGILSYFFYIRYLNDTNDLASSFHAQFVTNYQNLLSSYRKIPEAVFEGNLNKDEFVKQIFLANENSRKGKNAIKSYLDRHLSPTLEKVIEKTSISQIKIYMKNDEILLSVPQKYESQITPAALNMQNLQREYESFEVVDEFRGYHYFFPIFYQDEFVATAEIAIDFKHFIDIAASSNKSSDQIILSKKLANAKINQNTIMQMMKEYSYDIKSDDLLENTIKTLSTSQKSKIIDEFKAHKAVSVPIEDVSGKTFVLSSLPLENFDHEKVGYILSLKENNSINRLYFQMIQDNMVFAVLLVLSFVLLFMYKKQSELYQAIYKNQNTLEIAIENRTKKLSRYNSFLQSLFKTIPSAIFLQDLDSRIIQCNTAFLDFTKLTLAKIIGSSTREIIQNINHKKFLEADEIVLKTQKPYSYEEHVKIDEENIVYLITKNILKDNGEAIGIINIIQNITENKTRESKLENLFVTNKAQREKLLIDHKLLNRYAIFLKVSFDGIINKASQAFYNVSGYSFDEINNKPFINIMYEQGSLEIFNITETTELTLSCKRKDGNQFWLKTTIIPQEQMGGFLLYSTDISNEMYIKGLAYIDELTQTYNRKKLNETLEFELNLVKRYEPYTSILLFFDIDDFKFINDEFGHIVGDKVLAGLSLLIKDNLREVDIFARWGGDEFALLLPNSTLDGAIKTTEKLRFLIQEHTFEGLNITCSFGLTHINLNDTEESIIKRADEAMYLAKKSGKNCIEFIS